MILLLKASTGNGVQTLHTSMSRKKDGRIPPLSWTYAAAKLSVMYVWYEHDGRTGGAGSKKIRHSFSRKGSPYDNTCIESFHAVLKKEEIYLHTYQDFKESRKAIFEYIESWYNRKRIHSAIDYMPPQQKEDAELKKAA